MKVTRSCAYALHALMYMVRHNTQLPATAGAIARAEGIPSGYLVKIFRQLVKAPFVRAVRGGKRADIITTSLVWGLERMCIAPARRGEVL